MAVVLSDYPVELVQYVVDPRSGILSAFPNGLPNVGQIKEFCDGVQNRQARIQRYGTLPRTHSNPIAAPERKSGQVSYGEFLAMAQRGEVKSRPIGRFETG